jgi:hypothetical protein
LPRRKILANPTEEVAYRALDILRRRDAYGTKEIIARLTCVLVYAYTMKVDLPPTIVELARSIGVVIRSVELPAAAPSPPTIVPTVAPLLPAGETSRPTVDLTPTKQGGNIFEGMD